MCIQADATGVAFTREHENEWTAIRIMTRARFGCHHGDLAQRQECMQAVLCNQSIPNY